MRVIRMFLEEIIQTKSKRYCLLTVLFHFHISSSFKNEILKSCKRKVELSQQGIKLVPEGGKCKRLPKPGASSDSKL